ncbi:type I-E CRISPR-associated protein Cas6/Cse3/CasE [Sphingomonas sp. Mn802worker]|uniref:type I-E CRISPR-associated protein Cas6/Cse3/CasE n=1 Tax=Sphingomonas sp. Mn802worker TaxID=629773 RepID=UPI00036D054B|nr:type I-E CRISPR-associated protein Cas6/Cse3/CasE [Sphingomonas sp. Mn802worker]
MTLHLLRVGVDRRALHHFAIARRLDDDDAGYALHAALLARFGAAAPRPFRFLPDHPRGPHLLGYLADTEALADAAALPPADALIAAIFADHQLQPMPAAWRAGARYAFEVRVRPVVRFGSQARAARADRGAWQPRAGEIDAYVAACERAAAAGDDTAAVAHEPVYADWLAARLAGAAVIEHAGLRDFRRSRTRRNTHARADGPRTRAVEGPDAVMAGTLAIADPAAFADLLARGVGRHAAFGFGMLLLAPPGRAD